MTEVADRATAILVEAAQMARCLLDPESPAPALAEGLARLAELLGAGRVILDDAGSGDEQDLLRVQGEGEPPVISQAEEAALRAAGSLLGAALARRRSDEHLDARERQYQRLVENARDIVYIHDLEGRFVSINQAGLGFTGYSREDLGRLRISDVVAPEYLS